MTMVMEDLNVAILNQAKEDGFNDEPLPATPEEREAAATEIVTEALSAYKNGARGAPVVNLLTVAGHIQDGELVEPPPIEAQPVETENLIVMPTTEQVAEAVAETMKPATGFAGAIEAKELAIAKIKRDRLPIPQEIEGEPPVLPRDISALGDRELRRLHSEFNACLARVTWLLAIEEADELASRLIADYHMAKAVRKATGTPDNVTGKAKTVAVAEAEAASDPEVREWRTKQNSHLVEIRLLRALRDTYLSNCERASREFTMRSGERDTTA